MTATITRKEIAEVFLPLVNNESMFKDEQTRIGATNILFDAIALIYQENKEVDSLFIKDILLPKSDKYPRPARMLGSKVMLLEIVKFLKERKKQLVEEWKITCDGLQNRINELNKTLVEMGQTIER